MCDYIDLELMVDIINDAFMFYAYIFICVIHMYNTCIYTYMYKFEDSVFKALPL